MDKKSVARRPTPRDFDEAMNLGESSVAVRIREDAAAHPERTYREHVEAAQEIAAVEYRAEMRRMMEQR